MLEDTALLALCLWSEASGESDDGKMAVAQVVLNRMAARYQSDGTVAGTVLHPCAFSGFWYAMQGGAYVRVAQTLADAQARADAMLATAQRQAVWPVCYAIADQAVEGRLARDPQLEHALLYLDPAITPRLPAWASPDKQLAVIGRHAFYAA